MDERVFDALLKNALEEAARQDAEEAPRVEESWRQRRRMREMLADPEGYRRRLESGDDRRRSGRRGRFSRYVAVAVIAALLGGTAAAYTLRGGAFFRDMFERSGWAELYGDAADTEQLLEMGGGNVGAVVEDEVLRFEILDVVSDGQFAMVSVRCTLLDEGLKEELETSYETDLIRFQDVSITDENGNGPTAYGVRFDFPGKREDLGPYQYGLIFSFSNSGTPLSGRYTIVLKGLAANGEKSDGALLATDAWTLEAMLPVTDAEAYELDMPCTIDGQPGVLERLSLSPLALGMEFRLPEDAGGEAYRIFSETVIHLRSGGAIDHGGYSCGVSGGGGSARVMLEFQMPLDLDQVESIQVCGEEILLDDLRG